MVSLRTTALGTTTRPIASYEIRRKTGRRQDVTTLPPAWNPAFQRDMENPVSALALGRSLLLEILNVDLFDLLNKLIELTTLQQTRLTEDKVSGAEGHDRRDGSDLQTGRQLLLVLGVDLGEGHVKVTSTGVLIDW